MALINCTECRREISDQAAACPHCGKPLIQTEPAASNSPIKKAGCAQKIFLLAFTGALVTAIFLFAGNQSPPPVSHTPLDGSQIPAARAEQYIQKLGEEKYQAEIDRLNKLPRLTTPQLLKEYDLNEIAADQKYKGAEIILSAQVSAISKTLTGAPRLGLQGGSRQKEIPANLKRSQEDQAAKLSKNDQVTLRGVVNRSLLGKISFNDGLFFDESHPLAGHKDLE